MDFVEALVGYETRLWNHIDDRLRAARSPSLSTVFALRVVARHNGACRVQDVSSGLAITVGAASKLVDRLERDGLAVRRANPRDRRSSLIELTADGRSKLETGAAEVSNVLTEHLGHDNDVAMVTAVLERLDARLRPGAAEAAL